MNRNVIIGIVIAVLAIGGFVISRRPSAGAAAGQYQYKVAKADLGEVKKTVSASGTLQPWTAIDIKSRAGGEIKQLAVDVGYEVKKGQIIARIDPTDTLLTYNTAQADVDAAKAHETQSDDTYRLQTQQTTISIANASANLASARASRAAAAARLATAQSQSQAQPALTRSAIANARASYDQAVRQRQQLNATNPQQVASAKAAYDQAIANRNNARQSLDRQISLMKQGFVAQQTVDTAQANLEVNEAQVGSTKARLDTVGAELQSNVEAADARVAQTRAALDNAQAQSIDVVNKRNSLNELRAALNQSDAQVAVAQEALRQARANAANNQIKSLDVTAAKATIARNDATLSNARTILTQTTVRAPSNGVILKKYVDQGTIITSGLSLNTAGTSIVQLGDISRMYVDVTVDETDIANVDVGQSVDVNIEAYPGTPFAGKVTRVDPQATVEQNVTTIHVRVEVDNSAPTYRLLKPGMNATCEFVINKKDSVLSVSNDAIHEDSDGKYVEVAAGGKPAPGDPKTNTPADPDALIDVKKKRVTVETGIEGNDTTEILKGLKQGDTVITQTIEPVVAAAPAQGSPFGGGGGRPGGFGGGGGGRR